MKHPRTVVGLRYHRKVVAFLCGIIIGLTYLLTYLASLS